MAKHIEGSSRRISQNPSYARSTGSGYIGGKGKACINFGNSIYRQKTVESYAYNIWWRLKTFRERSESDMLQKRKYACLELFVDVLVRIVDVVDLDHDLGLVPHIDSGSYRKGRTTFNMAMMQCAYKNDDMTRLTSWNKILKHQDHLKWSLKCLNMAFL